MKASAIPDCRRPFVWDWEKDPKRVAMHAWCCEDIANPASRPLGARATRDAQGGGMTYAYSRIGGGEVPRRAERRIARPWRSCSTPPWAARSRRWIAPDGGAAQTSIPASATLEMAPESGRVFKITK